MYKIYEVRKMTGKKSEMGLGQENTPWRFCNEFETLASALVKLNELLELDSTDGEDSRYSIYDDFKLIAEEAK